MIVPVLIELAQRPASAELVDGHAHILMIWAERKGLPVRLR